MEGPIGFEKRCRSNVSMVILTASALIGASFTVLTCLYMNLFDWGMKGTK